MADFVRGSGDHFTKIVGYPQPPTWGYILKDIFKTYPNHFTKKFILETYPTNCGTPLELSYKFILHLKISLTLG